jgi:thioredoxin-related protein
MAKPIVDGIEKDLEGEARVIRLSVTSKLGGELARRYGVRGVPTVVVLDGNGEVVAHSVGMPNRAGIVAQVTELAN